MTTDARALLEPQLQLLARLAEVGLNLAVAIEAQGASEDKGAAPQELALAYGRVARAVRLTVALQSKLVKDLQDFDDAAVRERARERSERQRIETAQRAKVERIVERVIVAGCDDAEEVDRLADEASERLEHDDIYGELAGRPVSELVDRICRDLDLAPDWVRLADEAWAQEEIRRGVAAQALAKACVISAPAGSAEPEPEPQGAGPPRAELRAASP